MKKQDGFTLMETLIVTFLFAIILLVLFNIFDWQNTIFYFQQAQVEITGSSRNSLNDIQKYTAQAALVLDSQTIAGVTYNSGTTTLVLKLPAINSSGTTIPNTWDYAVFYQNSTQLNEIIQTDATSSRPSVSKQLSNTVSSLSFTYNNATFASVTKVTVDLLTQAKAKHETLTNHETSTIFLRNH